MEVEMKDEQVTATEAKPEENTVATSTTTEVSAPTEDVEEEEEAEEDDTSPTVDPSELKPFEGSSLPYDLSSLEWDREHTNNKQNCYCYCGKPKTKWTAMYKCTTCKQYFHLECLKQAPTHPALPGDPNYTFHCAICTARTNSAANGEKFELAGKSWTDIVRVAIYNLIIREKQRSNGKRFFQYKDEICQFIDKNWDSLCHGKTRTKTWENTIGSALSTKAHYFKSGAESLGAAGYWGLKSESDPSTFRKNPAAKPSGSKKDKKKTPAVVSASKTSKKRRAELLGVSEDNVFGSAPVVKAPKVRKPKAQGAPVFFPRQYYEPAQHGYKEVHLAKENSAPQVKIHPDLVTLSNEKGYRMARASFGASEGSWYYEVEILPHNGNTRLGWATEKADSQAPVGYDRYSYSYRDKEGTKFHMSHGKPYGESYGPGDVIGFYINLPPKNTTTTEDKPVVDSTTTPTAAAAEGSVAPQPLVATKKEEEEPPRLNGSEIVFYKNGVSQGSAFQNIYEGTYFPAAACYMGGMVRFNFGPNFKYPLPAEITHQPISELAAIAAAEAERVQQEKQAAEAAAATESASATAPAGEGDQPLQQDAATSAAPAVVSEPTPMSGVSSTVNTENTPLPEANNASDNMQE